jgi:hypothetical protein
MSPLEEPDETVLLELGRLTWAAINLEDVIPTMRRAIGPEPGRLSRAPASEWIKDALNVLSAWPESEIQVRACQWFRAAQDALEERNEVLHSVPVKLYTKNDDGRLTAQGQALDHIPRREGKPVIRTPLAEGQLRRVRQKLTDAREDWIEVLLALHEESRRRSNIR